MRFGLPAFGWRSLPLAQHHPVAGERQRLAIPLLAPVAGLVETRQWPGKALTVGEAQCCKVFEPGWHGLRAGGPIPNEQADVRRSAGVESVSGHGAGDSAAGAATSGFGLHMAFQSPIEFTLQDHLASGRQLLRNCRQLPGMGCPVLATGAVATADELLQLAVAIDQSRGHAVDLGLYPQVAASFDPVTHG